MHAVDTARALTRARDDMELCLGRARALVETVAYAVAHTGDDTPPTAAMAGTLTAAIGAMGEAEAAAKRVAELSTQTAADPALLGLTRH